ncbi:Ctr copper transporter [Trametes maxima]|nr:Ctr copper transporter [Trametes maxima]
MDMSMSSTNSTMMVMMVPYLHFMGGDNLLFKAWQPSSPGAIAGACIGLFLFAMFERWVNAMRGVAEGYWKRRALALMTDDTTEASCHTPSSLEPATKKRSSDIEEMKVNQLPLHDTIVGRSRSPRSIPPFIPSHDIPRGVFYAFQAMLSYALMLAVMTFQAAFIITIILGLGIGEVLFGRVGGPSSHSMH